MDRTAAPNSREVQSFLYIIELTLIDANAILLFGQKKVKSFGRLGAEAVVFGYLNLAGSGGLLGAEAVVFDYKK